MRHRQDFTRDSEFKKVYKIVVIAFEGADDKLEDRYFAGIQNVLNLKTLPASPKVYIHSIPNIEDKSAPNHILDNLKNFNQSDLDLDFTEDRSFLLIDYDRHLANIENHNIVKECKKESINLIICRPHFELWLLLHFEDISADTDKEKLRLLIDKKVKNQGKPIDNSLKKACGSASKKNLDFDKYKNNISQAITNSFKLDSSDNVIPDTLSARVDKILTEVGVNSG